MAQADDAEADSDDDAGRQAASQTTHDAATLTPEQKQQARSAQALPNAVLGLLALGADTNTRDADGNTPLYLAVHLQCLRTALAVTHLLLCRGADPRARCAAPPHPAWTNAPPSVAPPRVAPPRVAPTAVRGPRRPQRFDPTAPPHARPLRTSRAGGAAARRCTTRCTSTARRSCSGWCAAAPCRGAPPRCNAAWSKCPLGSAPTRLLCLLRAHLAALASSALPGRGPATGRLATASGARASRLQSRRFPPPLTIQARDGSELMGPDEIAPLRAARQKQLLQRAEAASAAVAKVEAKKLRDDEKSAKVEAARLAEEKRQQGPEPVRFNPYAAHLDEAERKRKREEEEGEEEDY